MRKFVRLGAAVAGVCVLSFGPFIWMGQLGQAWLVTFSGLRNRFTELPTLST